MVVYYCDYYLKHALSKYAARWRWQRLLRPNCKKQMYGNPMTGFRVERIRYCYGKTAYLDRKYVTRYRYWIIPLCFSGNVRIYHATSVNLSTLFSETNWNSMTRSYVFVKIRWERIIHYICTLFYRNRAVERVRKYTNFEFRTPICLSKSS